jgi:biotin carboxyl carrier protein
MIGIYPDGRRVRFAVSAEGRRLGAQLGGRLLQGELETSERGGSREETAGADLVAQFPGKVRKILVAAGATVEAGAALLLVEAMKMEFAINAPCAGKVTGVLVKEGQPLSPGDRFVEFEAAPRE